MRPSPPVHVTIGRFGVWRAGVGLLTAAVVVVTGIWLWTLQADAAGLPLRFVVAVLVAVVVAAAGGLLRLRPVSLRWDSQQWHLGPPSTTGQEPLAGRLRVAVDLGAWMLLRFDADTASRLPVARWIPVQRSAVGSSWHALRCAVYSPRPDTGPLDSGLAASTRPHRPG